MLILNTCSFQKRMLSNFTWVYSLTNRNVCMMDLMLRKLEYSEWSLFGTKRSPKSNFLRITNNVNLDRRR